MIAYLRFCFRRSILFVFSCIGSYCFYFNTFARLKIGQTLVFKLPVGSSSQRVRMKFEPPHGKSNNLHRRKQRRRSASRLCFHYTDSTFHLLLKFQASSSFLCLYRPVCVGPVRKPHCWFSNEAAHFCFSLSPPITSFDDWHPNNIILMLSSR